MSTPLRHAPTLEPSTDFPTLDLVPPLTEHDRPEGTIAPVLVLAGALLVGTIGFALGRATTGTPGACERAIDLAERSATVAVSDMRTVREGMLVFLDGETPEAYSILRDASLGVDRLQALRAELGIAAEACLDS